MPGLQDFSKIDRFQLVDWNIHAANDLVFWLPFWGQPSTSTLPNVAPRNGNATLNSIDASRWVYAPNGANGLSMDGTADYISASGIYWSPPPGANDETAITIAFWIKLEAGNSDAHYVRINSGSEEAFAIRNWIGNGTVEWRVRRSGGTVAEHTDTSINIDDGNWYHLCCTASRQTFAGEASTYLDGEFSATFSLNDAIKYSRADNLWIGYDGTSAYTELSISDFRIYGRSLTKQDVRELYRNPWNPDMFRDRAVYTLSPPKTRTTETLRPDGDSVDGAWTTDLGGTDLYTAIDEASPSDSDYIQSANNPSADTCVVTLSNPASVDTFDATGHRVSYRYQKSGSAGRTIELRVRLLQGASTEIASWTHSDIGDAVVQEDQYPTAAEIANITDWDDLRLEFRGQVSGSGAGRRAIVTWAELYVEGVAAAGAEDPALFFGCNF